MSYAWPNDRRFVPAVAEWRLVPNVIMFSSQFTGHTQTAEAPGARWSATYTMTPHENADRAYIEGWLNRVRGAAGRVTLWHPARPLPLGTLQANTTTSATAAYGATSISINATTGLTLLAGDMINVALANSTTQLVQVVQDATAVTNLMTVAFTPPLRWSVASAAAVTVIRPTASFMLTESPSIPYAPVVSPGFSLQFVEAL